MTKILEEVQALSQTARASKKEEAKEKLPAILQEIKGAAKSGKTSCKFYSDKLDEFLRELLHDEGFSVTISVAGSTNSLWQVSW